MSFSSVTIAVSDLPSFGGAVPGEMLVYGIFTVTPIVNRYTGKAIRLCITAVEATVSTSRFSKRAAPWIPGIASGRCFTKPLYSVLRVERGARSKTQVRSENPNPDEESNLHGEEAISEFICSVNCI
jgi:hypothetical protein